jgi:hypothetical protein
MARGAFRGALTAWLGLITLQVVTTKGGSSKVAGLFGVVDSVVQRALDPNVAAIPDHGKPDAHNVTSAAEAAVTAANRVAGAGLPVPPAPTPAVTGGTMRPI